MANEEKVVKLPVPLELKVVKKNFIDEKTGKCIEYYAYYVEVLDGYGKLARVNLSVRKDDTFGKYQLKSYLDHVVGE